MRSLRIPMSFQEYERMPWRFGWKHEYWDGHAHLTPRLTHVPMRLDVEPRAVLPPPGVELRAPEDADAEALVEVFVEAFGGGVEFCDWKPEDVRAEARRNIAGFFEGRRGAPHAASRLAVLLPDALAATKPAGGDPRNGRPHVLGTALVVERPEPTVLGPDGTVLDLLMVRPDYQRRGIASALVAAALGEMHFSGDPLGVLRGAYAVSNEESAAWHRAFGFVEEPDRLVASLRRAFYYHEMYRLEKEGGGGGAEHSRLKTEYELWRERAAELQEEWETSVLSARRER